VLILKQRPLAAALLKMDVAAMLVKLAVVVLPLIVVAPIKFGAAILSSEY